MLPLLVLYRRYRRCWCCHQQLMLALAIVHIAGDNTSNGGGGDNTCNGGTPAMAFEIITQS
jgi:hypothetical protein